MRHLMIALIVTAFAACTAPPAEPDPIDLDALKKEFQAMDDAYAEAQNSKNVDGVLAYYTDDAHNLPEDAPTVVGRDAMAQRIKADMAADTTGGTITFEAQEVFADGDLAVYIGHSTYTASDGSKQMGKYMSIMQKGADGKYLCVRDIWNSDADYSADEEDE